MAPTASPARPPVPSEREVQAGATRGAEQDDFVYTTPDGPPPPAGVLRRSGAAFRGVVRDANVKRALQGSEPLPAIAIGLQGFLKSFTSRVQAVSYVFVIASLGISNAGLSALAVAQQFVGVSVGLLVAYFADRVSRVKMISITTVVFGLLVVYFGVQQTLFAFIVATIGTTVFGAGGSSQSNSLLTDYYAPEARGRVFGLVAAIGTIGSTAWAIPAGILVDHIGFAKAYVIGGLVFSATAVLTLILREPRRGHWDLVRLGASGDEAAARRKPPSFAETVRAVKAVRTLHRVCQAQVFLSASGVVLTPLVIITLVRSSEGGPVLIGVFIALDSFGTLIGVELGGVFADRVLLKDPGRIMKALGAVNLMNLGLLLVFGFIKSPVVLLSIFIVRSVITTAPMVAQTVLISHVVPARIRTTGLQLPEFYGLLGAFLILPFAAAFGGSLATVFVVGASIGAVGAVLFIMSAVDVEKDIKAARLAILAEQESAEAEAAGRGKLLVCRGVDVQYDGTQVLFGVDFDVADGELVALLGTNGAGKSTLLRAISGISEPSGGAVFFDGHDTTHSAPHELARRGVVQMPGGKGVFPTLTVAENLRVAAWSVEDDADARVQAVYDFFPRLAERRDTLAGNLSGGEQQMVALGQTMVMRPRLLLIDELSLGLAPAVVEQLLQAVVALHEQGTTVVLVEQSVDLALTVAQRAVFMEKGEVRFDGPAEELRRRPELLRSVYITGTRQARATTRQRTPVERDTDALVLEATGLTVSYGGVHALTDADVRVARGEIVGLIGPNGAGKTTLFDAVCGFVETERGRVEVAGRDVTALPARERAGAGLARSFQDARLFPALSVIENVQLALQRHATGGTGPGSSALWLPQARKGEAALRRRAEALLDAVGLAEMRDKVPGELSTGTRRILDIALQMAGEPDVLLLDEPSSGIAQAETEELGPLLDRIRRDLGCGLLVIEHDMSLLTSVADRLIGMVLGHTVIEGSVVEVTSDPRMVAAYLGTSERVLARSTGAPGAQP